MKGYDDLYDRRKEPRFSVNEGAMAFVDKKYGKIIDVNMRGLSFQYIVKENRPLLTNNSQDKNLTLDIAFGSHNFCLTDVPIKIISDNECKSSSNRNSMLRKIRCGVQFKYLTPDQLLLLKRFVLIS
jgi:hypothetical protein